MGSGQRETTRTSRLLRGRRLDRNPLRRASDRAETLLLIALLVAFLVGAPLAALVSGGWAHAMAKRAESAQAASCSQVTAVVLAAPEGSTIGTWGMGSVTKARWTAPDGKVVTGELPVGVGTRAGTTVRIWTTADGQLTSHPMSDAQAARLADLGAAAGAVAAATALAVIGFLARWSLDKRRMAAWDEDWQATGPRWTTRA